jgi:two-component system, LytTR family, response regulator
MQTKNLNVLIVDDEKKACSNLKNILYEFIDSSINVAGMGYSTVEAEVLINNLTPDAIFLDIEMPHENAFSFLERIKPLNFEVIFVTAFDEYAINAFKLNAVDYILKPISINELKTAVQKLKEKIRYKNFIAGSTSYHELSEQVYKKAKPHKITLKGTNTTQVVDFKDIYFLEAHGSYSRILFLKGKEISEITMSNPLSEYEELLPADMFFRIHRSYLVNCTHIKKITNDDNNHVLIESNHSFPISRRRYFELIEFLKSNDYLNV